MALAVVVGLLDFWGTRFALNPDGISYVDMARHATANGPAALINGYWSPGYPALLAPVFWIVHTGWVTAIPVLHLVNVAIYVAALLVFLRLMRTAPSPARPEHDVAPGLVTHTTSFGAVLFAVIAIECISLELLTPDYGVMLVVLLTTLTCVQLERSTHSWRVAACLGLMLGVGYWMKGILLPLNALLLLGLFILPPRTDRARTKLLLASGVFALSVLPLIVLVSAKVGHLTIGEVGRLNYAWEVDGVTPFVGWLGDSTGRVGAPIHPPRVLQSAPRTLEFATPIRATYPLWYDPSYWYAGLRPRIDLAGQWRVLVQGLHDLASLLHLQWPIVAGLLALWLASAPQARPPDRSRALIVIALWSGAAALVYALVHVEPRYLAGFVAAAVVVIWSRLVQRTPRRAMPVVLPLVFAALLLSLGLNLRENVGGFEQTFRPDYLIDAAQLRQQGVAAGDHVAMIGDAFEAYAAFAAETPITVQVMDSTGFWNLAPAARSALQARIAATGVKAILANNVAPERSAEGWQLFFRSDSSNLGVLLLRP
jgi:cell division protein FtsW (lipid II flippase)